MAEYIDREKITRTHHEKQLWTRFGTIFLGFWLLAAPGTFGYNHTILSWSDWISGALLIFFGLISLSYPFRAWIWGGCLVGVWLQYAPLAFWAADPVIYLNDTLIGVLAIAFCVLVPLRPKELELGPDIPPGWTYNPSSWHQRVPIIFLATVAWFLARYLTSYQLHYINFVWDPFFGMGTTKVITSMISQQFPVPDAGMGALAYSLEAIMGAKGGARRWHTMPWLVFIFGILVVPVGFVSIILVMLQPIAVGAWCGICLIIALCMLFMLALSVDEVVAVLQFLKRSKQEGKSLWKTFWAGSAYTEKGVDTRTPTFHSSPFKIFRSMFWGLTLPWNMVLTALLGIWILFSNKHLGVQGILADNADVCAALIVTLSVISFAEVIRGVRFGNILLALWFAIGSFVLPGGTGTIRLHNVIIAVVIIVLSLFRGKIKEHYGSWDKMII
jgi:uncharacterized membrane protein